MTVRRYDGTALFELLPHRPPVLLVDRIDVLEPGKHVVGTKFLTASEWWNRGDPRTDIPHTLLIEALAQTGAALLVDLADRQSGAIGYFMGASHVRLRAGARAGDSVVLDVTLSTWRRGICRTRGVATLPDGKLLVSSELTTIVRRVA